MNLSVKWITVNQSATFIFLKHTRYVDNNINYLIILQCIFNSDVNLRLTLFHSFSIFAPIWKPLKQQSHVICVLTLQRATLTRWFPITKMITKQQHTSSLTQLYTNIMLHSACACFDHSKCTYSTIQTNMHWCKNYVYWHVGFELAQ